MPKRTIRETDYTYRSADRGYCLLIELSATDDVNNAGRRVRDVALSLSIPVFGGKILTPTVTIGVLLEVRGERFGKMLRGADDALLIAKERAQSCFIVVASDYSTIP